MDAQSFVPDAGFETRNICSGARSLNLLFLMRKHQVALILSDEIHLVQKTENLCKGAGLRAKWRASEGGQHLGAWGELRNSISTTFVVSGAESGKQRGRRAAVEGSEGQGWGGGGLQVACCVFAIDIEYVNENLVKCE